MGRHSPRPTCLGDNSEDLLTYEHSDRVLDVSLHYFGCLRVTERAAYFASLPRKSKILILEEQRRIERWRSLFEATPKSETGAILKEFKDAAKFWYRQDRKQEPGDRKYWPLGNGQHNNIGEDVKAGLIYFKNSRPYDIPGFENEFPNQKIPVQRLLAEDPNTNPLMQPSEANMIRYFHLPANNMVWVEEAIARYYHERRPDPEDVFQSSNSQGRTKSQMLLRPELWLGQQHGDGASEVHARHMRPLCDTVSTVEKQNNVVLFMHYLHWETDRGRVLSAKAIKEAGKAKFSTLGEVVDQVKANEQNTRNDRQSIIHASSATNQNPQPHKLAPTIERRQALGRMLFHAAKLAEAMDSYADESLINEHLHESPPLHPRRTLDQSYYGALRDTQTRDRDQVIYRATNPGPHDCVALGAKEKCRGCQTDIQKVPRVIMVDQLWMWILDENTIISSFPQRWGRNKSDPSAVYKSIRTRLSGIREDEIHSVFDLALIVVDECSRVFFDRSKPVSQAPKLVDIFADAITGVTYKQTAAFDQFLTYTHLASKDYNSKGKFGDTAMQNALLNINPEGNLLKEIKDILDELHIMTRIKLQQQVVANSFLNHIKRILLPRVAASQDPWMGILDEYGVSDESHTTAVRKEQFESVKSTLARADGILRGVQERIEELKTLEDAATNTSIALKDLLTLKQQQAGVIEAREAVKQATETLKQGRSIMLFTVVTIIFLPLGFCASVFGMNTAEFNGGLLTLHEEFYYMFPISTAIIGTSFLLAFTSSSFLSAFFSLIWALISYPINIVLTWTITKSGLYTFSRELVVKANGLKDKERKKTGIMKGNALREKLVSGKMEMWKTVSLERDEIEMEKLARGDTGSSRSGVALYDNSTV